MDLSDYVRFQIKHSCWAIEHLIMHAGRLPQDAIEQDMNIGPGSLRVNIAHTIEAMFFFADCFAGKTYEEPADFAQLSLTLKGLCTLQYRAHKNLEESMLSAIARGLPAMVPWTGTDIGEMPAAAALAQVFDHATLHRTRCINMLKRLGVQPLPDLDPMAFCL